MQNGIKWKIKRVMLDSPCSMDLLSISSLATKCQKLKRPIDCIREIIRNENFIQFKNFNLELNCQSNAANLSWNLVFNQIISWKSVKAEEMGFCVWCTIDKGR